MTTLAPPQISHYLHTTSNSVPFAVAQPKKSIALPQIGYTTGSLSMGKKVIIRKPDGTTNSSVNSLGGGKYRVSFLQRTVDGSCRVLAECKFSSPEGCEKDISRQLDMPSRDLVLMFCYDDDDSLVEEIIDGDSEDDVSQNSNAELPKRRGCCHYR